MRPIGFIIVTASALVIALAPSPAKAQTASMLFARGKEAFEQGNNLDAAKFFFALSQTPTYRAADNTFRNSIEEALRFADNEIRIAVDYEKSVRSHGPVLKVVVRTHGVFVAGVPDSFTLPAPQGGRHDRPELREGPPAEIAGGASFEGGKRKEEPGSNAKKPAIAASKDLGGSDKELIVRLSQENKLLRSKLARVSAILSEKLPPSEKEKPQK